MDESVAARMLSAVLWLCAVPLVLNSQSLGGDQCDVKPLKNLPQGRYGLDKQIFAAAF